MQKATGKNTPTKGKVEAMSKTTTVKKVKVAKTGEKPAFHAVKVKSAKPVEAKKASAPKKPAAKKTAAKDSAKKPAPKKASAKKTAAKKPSKK